MGRNHQLVQDSVQKTSVVPPADELKDSMAANITNRQLPNGAMCPINSWHRLEESQKIQGVDLEISCRYMAMSGYEYPGALYLAGYVWWFFPVPLWIDAQKKAPRTSMKTIINHYQLYW
jgi:hypothetical protein